VDRASPVLQLYPEQLVRSPKVTLTFLFPIWRNIRGVFLSISFYLPARRLLSAACLAAFSLFLFGCAAYTTSNNTPPAQGTLVVSPSVFNFNTVAVGQTATQNVTLQNSGTVSVTINGVTVVGAGFGFSNLSPGFSLSPSQQVTFQVWFRPQVSGVASGTVSFVSSNVAVSPTLSLSGSGASSTQHTVHLAWNPDSGAVAGYRVYRGQVSGGPYAPVSPGTVGTPAYNDATVSSGSTYYYVVTAVDASGVESSYSNEAAATVPTP
jgi:hypothetical protein